MDSFDRDVNIDELEGCFFNELNNTFVDDAYDHEFSGKLMSIFPRNLVNLQILMLGLLLFLFFQKMYGI